MLPARRLRGRRRSGGDPEAIRIRAYALQALGRLPESVAACERLVALPWAERLGYPAEEDLTPKP